MYGARGSRLMRLLRDGHEDVRLRDDDLRRLALWIDLNAIFYGVNLPDDQARMRPRRTGRHAGDSVAWGVCEPGRDHGPGRRYMGRTITWQEMIDSTFAFSPIVDPRQLAVRAGPAGRPGPTTRSRSPASGLKCD